MRNHIKPDKSTVAYELLSICLILCVIFSIFNENVSASVYTLE
jgi:hypothetical protein